MSREAPPPSRDEPPARDEPGAWILLHGFGGRASSWTDVAAALGGEAKTSALDLFGHGPDWARRSVPDATFEGVVDALAEELAARRAELGVGALGIAGYSLGARVALALVARHPALCSRAVLVSGSAGLEHDDERRARRAADAAWIARLRKGSLEAFFEAWEAQPVLARGPRVDPSSDLGRDRLAAHRARRLEHDAEGLARAMEVLGLASMPNLWGVLPNLELPVTLVVGARDAKFRTIAARMAALLPNAALEEVPDAGHDLLLEAPEAVARAISGRGGG